MKIVSIVGARPQFIKASIVSRKLQEQAIDEVMVHTGQHYDFIMSDVFFQELGISVPYHNLGIGSASHGLQTGQMLEKIEAILIKEEPDLVLVYGDTNSTLAGALAAAKLHFPVVHIEAGLRSFDKKMPEEINRILTDHVSDTLFSPTDTGIVNLKHEGFLNCVSYEEVVKVLGNPLPLCVNVGDVMFDIALEFKDKIDDAEILKIYGVKRKEFILATVHRQENTNNRVNLDSIMTALTELATNGKTVVLPLHPRTKKELDSMGFFKDPLPEKLLICNPVSYQEMIGLEVNARVILTDSGGVQKEGYFFKTPCVIARDQTEWIELVDGGWNIIAGANKGHLIKATNNFWDNNPHAAKPNTAIFGEGNAADKIVNILRQKYC